MKCSGCGVILQSVDKDKIGYTNNLDSGKCMRCFRLANYGEYNMVDLDNGDFFKIIDGIPEDNLVVYITDILSFNLDVLDKFKRVLVVITKSDIIPRNVKNSKIIDYVKRKKSNVIDVVMVSSFKNYNMDFLYNLMINYCDDRPVYFVGNTNTGKSTLVNKLIYNYSDCKDNVTVSMYPSTTLDKVEVKLDKIVVIDTPGVIDKGNIINYVDSKELRKIVSKGEIRPRSMQIKRKGSILIDDYVRIDYVTKIDNSLVVYVPSSVDVKFNSRKNDKLLYYSLFDYNIDNNKDIVIPGLGFIKFTKNIDIKMYILDGVIPYVRDNLI
jgi:hypothetical protein